jgi:hypothetical protein
VAQKAACKVEGCKAGANVTINDKFNHPEEMVKMPDRKGLLVDVPMHKLHVAIGLDKQFSDLVVGDGQTVRIDTDRVTAAEALGGHTGPNNEMMFGAILIAKQGRVIVTGSKPLVLVALMGGVIVEGVLRKECPTDEEIDVTNSINHAQKVEAAAGGTGIFAKDPLAKRKDTKYYGTSIIIEASSEIKITGTVKLCGRLGDDDADAVGKWSKFAEPSSTGGMVCAVLEEW